MPNPGADAPLRKVTLNLYESDCAKLELSYGHGWTTVVRDWVNQHVRGAERKLVLGDLEDSYQSDMEIIHGPLGQD